MPAPLRVVEVERPAALQPLRVAGAARRTTTTTTKADGTRYQGITYAVQVAGDRVGAAVGAQPAAAAPAVAPCRQQHSEKWLMAITNAQLRGSYNARDVAAILGQSTIDTTADVVLAAAKRGISLTETQAANWRATTRADVAAFNELKTTHDFLDVQARQRKEVEAPRLPAASNESNDAAAEPADAGGVPMDLVLPGSSAAPFAGPVSVETMEMPEAAPAAAPAALPAAAAAAAAAAAEVEDPAAAAAAAALEKEKEERRKEQNRKATKKRRLKQGVRTRDNEQDARRKREKRQAAAREGDAGASNGGGVVSSK